METPEYQRLAADPEFRRLVGVLSRSKLAEHFGSSERVVRNAKALVEGSLPEGTEAEVDRTVFLNDIHIPYEDTDAVRVALALIQHLQPSHVFLNGDVVDFYALSKFDKDPNRALLLQEDLDKLDGFLKRLRAAAPKARIVYTEGNHEARLRHYLWRHPEFSNLRNLQAPELLGLKAHNIEWVPQKKVCRHHGFIVTHGTVVRKHSSYSAKGEFEKWGSSGISGHTHRVGMYRNRNDARDAVWFENGCLCGLDPEYVVGTPDWQHALAVGEFIQGDDRFQIAQVNIVNGKLLWGGLLFE